MNFTKILFAGMGTYLTPCVYPLIPIYLSSLMGVDISEVKGGIKRGQLLLRSIAFSLGFILVFSLMGLGAAGIGAFLNNHKGLFQLMAGVLIFIFALKFLGVIEIPFMNKTIRKDDSKLSNKVGMVSSFLMGFFFAAGWSPCIGPILGSVLTYTASQTSNPLTGMFYLTTYGVGFAIPLIITALFAESGAGFVRRTSRFLPWFEKGMGIVMLLAAFYFFNTLLSGYNTFAECKALADPTNPKGKPLMVEFYSKNCHICKQMKPTVDEIKQTCIGKNVDIHLVDISESKYSYLKKQHNLIGVPTFIIFDKSGKEISRLVGANSKKTLLQAISAATGETCPLIGPLPEHGKKGHNDKGKKLKQGSTCKDTGEGIPLCTE